MSETAVVITISTRAAAGMYEDKSGPIIAAALDDLGLEVSGPVIVPDGDAVGVALRDGTVPKGDALAVARIAGIQGAKKTPDLIPLCHPLFISGVDVIAEVTDEGVEITATVKTTERTGVEMEALTAVVVAGLAVIDMIKAIDRAAVISDVRVLSKSGGRRGDWSREGES